MLYGVIRYYIGLKGQCEVIRESLCGRREVPAQFATEEINNTQIMKTEAQINTSARYVTILVKVPAV